jgi:filamentous hemagglutinin
MHLPLALWRGMSLSKVENYLLNEDHPDGRSKAKFFKSFGFVAEHAESLITALFDHPIRNSVFEVKSSPFGEKYVIRCAIETPDGRNPCVVSIWVIEPDRRPRLVTAYPA